MINSTLEKPPFDVAIYKIAHMSKNITEACELANQYIKKYGYDYVVGLALQEANCRFTEKQEHP